MGEYVPFAIPRLLLAFTGDSCSIKSKSPTAARNTSAKVTAAVLKDLCEALPVKVVSWCTYSKV